MASGDVIKLGTLFMNSTKRIRPTKPWRTNSVPTGAPSAGDIPDYIAGATLEIRNTDASDAYKMQWVEVNDGDKKLLIGDRNALVNISWDDLNALGLINGKTVTIDGQEYLLRVLTGGNNYRAGSDAYSGGTLPNEWDRYIVNEGNIPNLLKPAASDLDSTPDATDFNSAHNKLWNWYYCYSWAKEIYVSDSALRASRGYDSARRWSYYSSTNRLAHSGWRPALEVLNTAPLIFGNDEDLGNKSTNFEVNYTVSDSDAGDVLTVIEKIDGVVKKTIPSANQNFQYTINVDISSLELGSHTVSIEASDDKGAKTIRTYTFNITAKQYLLTLDKNINVTAGEVLVSKDLIATLNGEDLVLVGADLENKKLIFKGVITGDKINLTLTAKDIKTVKKIVYTVY